MIHFSMKLSIIHISIHRTGVSLNKNSAFKTDGNHFDRQFSKLIFQMKDNYYNANYRYTVHIIKRLQKSSET